MEPETIRHDNASNTGKDTAANINNTHMASKNVPSKTMLAVGESSDDITESNGIDGDCQFDENRDSSCQEDHSKSNSETGECEAETLTSYEDLSIGDNSCEKENMRRSMGGETGEGVMEICEETVPVSQRRKWLKEQAFQKQSGTTGDAKDSVTLIERNSVTKRASWLQGAFKKEDTSVHCPKPSAASATTKPMGVTKAAVAPKQHCPKPNKPALTTTPSANVTNKVVNKTNVNVPKYEKPHASNVATNYAKASNNKVLIGNKAAKFGALKQEERPAARPKELSAVQKKKLALEKLAKEESMKNNPQAYLTTSWKAKQSYGQYQKKTKDSRGVAPKKSFADLP